MSAKCDACGRVIDGCLGLTDGCRYRLLLAAAHRLLVAGTDPTRGDKCRAKHRRLARRQMRIILEATDTAGPAAVAREMWPTWAREIDAAVSNGRAAC
jgi:hypothetical protein